MKKLTCSNPKTIKIIARPYNILKEKNRLFTPFQQYLKKKLQLIYEMMKVQKAFLICALVLFSVCNFHESWSDVMSHEVALNIEKLLETKRCIQCDLTGAKLDRADLSEADLRGSRLRDVTFFLADLANCNFQNCDLRDAQFGGADLSGADFRGADISGVSFGGAYLKGAIFKKDKQKKKGSKAVVANEKVTPLSKRSDRPDFTQRPYGSSAAPPVKKIQPIGKVIVSQ